MIMPLARALLACGCLARCAGAEGDLAWSLGVASEVRILDFSWRSSASPQAFGLDIPFDSQWRNVTAVGGRLDVAVDWSRWFVHGTLDRATVVRGGNTLTGFSDDSRTLAIYQADSRSDQGHCQGMGVSIGTRCDAAAGHLHIDPEVGYGRDEQELVLTDGVQTVPATGPFPDLHSRYHARWQGPWLGLGCTWPVTRTVSLRVGGRMRWGAYHASANWNLRSDLSHPDSTTQDGPSGGWDALGELSWRVLPRLTLAADATFARWRVTTGSDRVNFADGTHADSQLEEAKLSSMRLGLGATWRF